MPQQRPDPWAQIDQILTGSSPATSAPASDVWAEIDRTLSAPPPRSYASMADELHAPAPSPVSSDILPSGAGRPVLAPPPLELASPFAADVAALQTPVPPAPSIDELSAAKRAAMTPGQPPVTRRLGSAKTGGAATENPIGSVPVLDAPGVGARQIAQGLRGFAAVATDTTPVTPSTAPFRRSRTGALYQPPPPIDPRTKTAAADVLEGGMKLTEPLVAALAVASPFEVASALIKGGLAAAATQKALVSAGVTPETARLASDAAGALGAGVPLRETYDRALLKLYDTTRAMADAAESRRAPAPTVITPAANDITVVPERARLASDTLSARGSVPPTAPDAGRPSEEDVWDAIDRVVTPPSEPRSAQGPTTTPAETPIAPAAVRPGAGESVAPVAPSPDAPPVAPTVVQTTDAGRTDTPADLYRAYRQASRAAGQKPLMFHQWDDAGRPTGQPVPAAPEPPAPSPEFVPVGDEQAYTGPERRGADRVSTPEEDQRYAEMREKIARGETTGTQAAREAFVERQRVEGLRPDEPPRDMPDEDPRAAALRDARAEGYNGTDEEFNRRLNGAIATAGDISGEGRSAHGGDQQLLTDISKYGGIRLDKNDPYHGEIAWLWEHGGSDTQVNRTTKNGRAFSQRLPSATLGGVRGVLHQKEGLSLDHMAENLRQDPKYAHIQGPNELIDAVKESLTRLSTGQARAVAPNLRPGWWKRAGDVVIPPGLDLSPEEQSVEAPFREAVSQRTAEMVDRYIERFGNVVDADKAKHLAADSADTPEFQARFSRAVHPASSGLAGAVYRRLLEQPTPDGKTPEVVFVTGPTGAGKGSIRQHPALAADLRDSDIVVDGPMSNVQASMTRIQQAVDSGRSVNVIYVHRDPVEAWRDGVMRRAATEGRMTPLDYHVQSHVGGLRTIRALIDAYGDHPKVHIELVQNRTDHEPESISASNLPEAYNEGDVRAGIEASQATEGPEGGGAREAAESRGDDGAQRRLSEEPRGKSPQEVAPSPDGDVWQQIDEAIQPPREFSSSQVDLSPADAAAIKAAAARIPDADLADDGREDQPHITVKFGLHTNDDADLRRVLAGERPITATLGKTSIFPAKDGADYDVVKVDVVSPDLHRLNAKIAKALPHTDTHPTYKPHVTLAYVKPGLGKKYVGRDDLSGRTLTFDSVTFSGKDRQIATVPLTERMKPLRVEDVGSAALKEARRTAAEDGKPRYITKTGPIDAVSAQGPGGAALRVDPDGQIVPISSRGDVLETGETQPRLPGDVGDVREREIATPAEEAPFSLKRETASRTHVQPKLGDIAQSSTAAPRRTTPVRKAEQTTRSTPVTLQATVLPGAKEFVEQDVVPAVQAAAEEVNEARKDIRTLFAPDTVGDGARAFADVMRVGLAAHAQRVQRAQRALRGLEKSFDKRSNNDNLAFIDAIEGGDIRALPAEQRAAAEQLRELLDTKRNEVRRRGKLDTYIENYFPHEWKQPTKAKDLIRRILGRRPLQGPKSFLKKRSIPTVKEGIAAGLEPASYNPVTLVLHKLAEMDKWVMAHDILKDAKALGIARFVRAGGQPPEGWQRYHDSFGTVYAPPFVKVEEAYDERLMEKLHTFATSLGITAVRRVRIATPGSGVSSRAWGYAVRPTGPVVTKVGGPETVLEHEIGHVLDWKYGLWDKIKKELDEERFDSHERNPARELQDLADRRFEGQKNVTDSFKRYVRKKEEKIANLVHAFIYNPEMTKEVAPNAYWALYNLAKDNDELAPLIELQKTKSLVLGTSTADKRVNGTVIGGHYYGPPDAVRILNNYLSPGLRGNAVFDMYRAAGNMMNQVQLGLSGFHLTMTGIEAMVSKMAQGVEELSRGELTHAAKSFAETPVATLTTLFKGDRALKALYAKDANMRTIVDVTDAIVQGGGGAHRDQTLKVFDNRLEGFIKALRQGNVIGAVGRAPFALIEAPTRFIMEWWVPRLKLGAYIDMARMELRTLGPQPSLTDARRVLGGVQDSIDNRFGQLVYDNLFWHNALKDLGMGSVRALGWNIGTVREVFGAPSGQLRHLLNRPQRRVDTGARTPEGEPVYASKNDPWLTHKGAYVIAMVFGVGMLGALYQYLHAGEPPSSLKDYFFPRTGRKRPDGREERVSFPSYFKDVYAVGHALPGSAGQTLAHKLHPLLNLLYEVWANEDYYGTEIRNTDDPMVAQAREMFEHVAASFVPISLRSFDQRQQDKGRAGISGVESFFGVTPAPVSVYRSKAEDLIQRYLPPSVRSREQSQRAALARQVREGVRAGDEAGRAEASKAVATGELSNRQISNAVRSAGLTPLEAGFKHLTLEQALNVYDVASPRERAELWPLLEQKSTTSLPLAAPADLADLSGRLRRAQALQRATVGRSPVAVR